MRHTQSELAAAKASVKATLGDKERKINELVEELGTTQAMLTATQNELSVVRRQGLGRFQGGKEEKSEMISPTT